MSQFVEYSTPTIISLITACSYWLCKKKIERQYGAIAVSLWPSFMSPDPATQRIQRNRAVAVATVLSILWTILVYLRLNLGCKNCVDDDEGKIQTLTVASHVVIVGYTAAQAQFLMIQILGPLFTDNKYDIETGRVVN